MSGVSDPHDWIGKARQDARSARRLLADPPEMEVAAYHVQQTVEKAIKALLVARDIPYPRGKGSGHDLDVLARLIPATSPLSVRALVLADLTVWATAFRYPADDPFTAQPLPSQEEVGRRLGDAAAFVEAAAVEVMAISPRRSERETE